MLKQNNVKRLLHAGKPALGMWMSIPSVLSAEALATVGWDWLTLDVEHGCFNFETQQAMFITIASQDCVPLARIPHNPTVGLGPNGLGGNLGEAHFAMSCSASPISALVTKKRSAAVGVS